MRTLRVDVHRGSGPAVHCWCRGRCAPICSDILKCGRLDIGEVRLAEFNIVMMHWNGDIARTENGELHLSDKALLDVLWRRLHGNTGPIRGCRAHLER